MSGLDTMDYEEWDYLNPAFNDKLLTRKEK